MYSMIVQHVKKNPNQSCSCIFYRTARRPPELQHLFTHEQERTIVNIVLANNAVHVPQLLEHIIADHKTFHNSRVSVYRQSATSK